MMMYRVILVFLSIISIVFLESCKTDKQVSSNPNVILVMADDLGYGDVASYGNSHVLTPNLDDMANTAVKFERFYAAAPVCSPTRGSCLTGRHPYRYNMPWAGKGHIPKEEITIAEVLKTKGYATGHFGKWHVGTLSKTVKQSYFSGEVDPEQYSPPWENGFDECFSTESMMPTYNPYYMVGGDYGSDDYRFIQTEPIELGQEIDGFKWRDFYWTGEGVTIDKLEGDDSKIIMDQALDFIDRQHILEKPFLSVIWFHTPHTPVVAGPEHRQQYADYKMEEQHWYGAITAMDEQIGRLRKYLKDNEINENTIVWFCSDNGPSYIHNINSNGGLRDKKASLFEGGIRVPAILEWPSMIKKPLISQLISSTSDFLPSILWACGVDNAFDLPELDGENVLKNIVDNESVAEKLIFFQSPLPARLKKDEVMDAQQMAAIGMRFKLISIDDGRSFQLYDLEKDKKEKDDVAHLYPNIVKDMKRQLEDWQLSCQQSSEGKDYN